MADSEQTKGVVVDTPSAKTSTSASLNQTDAKAAQGAGSFCIPRAALEALIKAKANAYEICTYPFLSRFTDATGMYSSVSISAVNRYTGANKVKDGPMSRSIERLKTIQVTRQVSNDRKGKAHRFLKEDVGPILYARDDWHEATGEVLPDGPVERAKVLFVLPDFDEPVGDRVWFGGNLMTGVGGFHRPLKQLKNAGPVAVRLLLRMYTENDMETWGGVRPINDGHSPRVIYDVIDDKNTGEARIIRAKRSTTVAIIDNERAQKYWDALSALESRGFIYETVIVLNRNAVETEFSSGDEYAEIPDHAEPLYELDSRSQHGYKPAGEEGMAVITAKVADALGYPVAIGGHFDLTYAAIMPKVCPAMVIGIYRLRFRVSNPKNVGVSHAWGRIQQNNRDALEFIERMKAARGLVTSDAVTHQSYPLIFFNSLQ
jgi:hypothetical protein